MHKIEILKPQSASWVDHLGNDIDRLVLSKKYEPNYIPGYYPIQSFGALDRSISDIPERPIQSLTDWTISINSMYSSKDGSFSTIDLVYFLEAKNEELGKEFNLVGCVVCLFDSEEIIFIGVVNAVESSNGIISINVSERIGSPSIAKNPIPLVLGNTSADSSLYWPVEITKDDLGAEQIILSQTPLQRFDGLFIYDEKSNRYIECEFENFKVSADNKRIDFIHDEVTLETNSEILPLGIFSFDNLDASSLLRPDATQIEPTNYAAGTDSFNREIVQAWSNQAAAGLSGPMLGRSSDHSARRNHPTGTPLRRIGSASSMYFYITLIDRPISVTETGAVSDSRFMSYGGKTPPSFPRQKGKPAISGTPANFLNNFNNSTNSNRIYDYLSVRAGTYVTNPSSPLEYARFSFNLPEIDLPSSAIVEECTINFLYELLNSSNIRLSFEIGDNSPYPYSLPTYSQDHIYKSDFNEDIRVIWSDWSSGHPTFANSKVAHLHILLDTYHNTYNNLVDYPDPPFAAFYSLQIRRKVKVLFNSVKLFAKGLPASFAVTPAPAGNYVIPAVNSLLTAASVLEYNVQADGELPSIEYSSLIRDESADFRDKLGALAQASATLMRFDSVSDSFLVKSISRHDITVIPIPRKAILEENNIYNFKMQTPKRTDVYSGLEISWGKNSATDKYENKTLVDENKISHNGIFSDPIDNTLEWDGIFNQLEKSSREGKANVKIIENEWIRNREGAEYMAYNYLYWTCVPLRKAEVNCIKPWLPPDIGLGSFVSLDLPGYPAKLASTAWIVTGITDDIDNYTANIALTEVWNVPVIPLERFLATENLEYIATEQDDKIQLER